MESGAPRPARRLIYDPTYLLFLDKVKRRATQGVAIVFRHHITSASLFRRLGILDIDSYFHNRILRWAGHVARMPMSRAPRQLLMVGYRILDRLVAHR